LVLADELLLLGVDADRRPVLLDRGGHLVVDVAKLRVTVRMLGALLGLAVGLQAVAELVQQPRDGAIADLVTQSAQLDGELAHAL
jgi:hypothetical protein